MDWLAPSVSTAPAWSPRLLGWALPRGRDINESDPAFAAGIALKSLDDMIRAEPPWLGCWRDRLALKSATVAARMIGRDEEESAIRDAVLLTAAGDDPGPAGKLFLATRMLTRRSGTITTPLVKELSTLLGIRWDEGLAEIPDLIDSARQSGRAAPFVAPDLTAALCAARRMRRCWRSPISSWRKLNWPKPVPLLLPERFGAAFRTIGGRVRPGEPAYPKAICLALVDGASVTEVARRYSVTRQQVYTWRRELRKKGLLSPPSTTVFLPLDMPPAGDSKEARAFDGMQVLPAMMELQLRCGRSLRFSGDVDVVALKRLIRAIEAA